MGGNMKIIATFFVLFVILSGNALGKEFYSVIKGDSLYKIAKRFHVSVSELKEANNLSGDRLKSGMRLKIPSRAEGNIKQERYRELSKVKEEKRTQMADTESVSADYHIVKKGDTLASIAKKYGISISDLKELNDLRAKRLKIGQKILLKKSGPRTYTVKKGDNIWKIAKRFNLDADEIMELNELESDELKPGQKLILEAWIDEKELKRYEAAISELRSLDETKTLPDNDLTKIGFKERVVLFAKKMLNIPYRFGGSSFMGIDCSGYVQKVFSYLNIPLPRTAREQFKVGEPVDKDELNIGDLVFFRTYASFPSHVGIYLGNNLFIHASSRSRKVTIDSLDTPYYLKRFIGAKRIISETASEEHVE